MSVWTSIRRALRSFWQKGLPGWIFATALTGTGVLTFWLAGLDYWRFFELWKVAGSSFATLNAGLISAWLGYRGFKWWNDAKQQSE